MAIANRQPFTAQQRLEAIRHLRASLVSDFVQTHLIPCRPYAQAALRNWQTGGVLHQHIRHLSNVASFLANCHKVGNEKMWHVWGEYTCSLTPNVEVASG